MESKSIILESSINFKTKEESEQYRKRDNARAFVEKMRRKRRKNEGGVRRRGEGGGGERGAWVGGRGGKICK